MLNSPLHVYALQTESLHVVSGAAQFVMSDLRNPSKRHRIVRGNDANTNVNIPMIIIGK